MIGFARWHNAVRNKTEPGNLTTLNAINVNLRRLVPPYGGSKPPGFHGLQRQMRPVPRHAPRIAPYFRTAPMKYALHDG